MMPQATMSQATMPRTMHKPALAAGNDNLANFSAMTAKLGIDPTPASLPGAMPAAWPTGVSLLAQAIDACQRCETTEVCGDWLARAPARIAKAPAFCPNAETFETIKRDER